jgi:hypothetical protein
VAPTGVPSSGAQGSGLGGNAVGTGGEASGSMDCDPIPESDKQAILDNVIKLIQTAALKPGGDNFAIATQNLNQYFCGVPSGKFALAPADRAVLLPQMSEAAVQDLEDRTFRMPDARHIEDCMLYHSVATRVGGVGDDASRVRRVFRWIIEQIQLVPPGALAAPRLGHAEARPYDVLMRGMATEDGGSWAERGWLFIVLCRQLGVDACLLTYTPPDAKDPVVWTAAALIDGKLCLFDTRLGLEIAGPGGVGLATLDDALTDPSVLAVLDLPGQSSYRTSRDSLLASTSKIGVLIDSSPHYRSPRMELLQEDLAGRNRTILFSAVSGERDRLQRALGTHAGSIGFWELPARVEHLLFSQPRFVEATLFSLVLFDPNRFPLVYARVKQLRGDMPDAVKEYVDMRLADNPMTVDKRAKIPPEVQQAIDIFATYYLGLCNLEQGDAKQAKFFFEQTLLLLPEPGRGQPYYNMFRWGAQANLGRLCEASGDDARAIAYYTKLDPTPQGHGNLVRARALVWRAPMADLPPELPAAPVPTPPPPASIAAPPGR